MEDPRIESWRVKLATADEALEFVRTSMHGIAVDPLHTGPAPEVAAASQSVTRAKDAVESARGAVDRLREKLADHRQPVAAIS